MIDESVFDYDVCVVGGGPSGVICAYAIAKAGYTCIILDKKPRDLIGDKNCGDALDGLHVDIIHEKLGIEPPSLKKGEARELINIISIAAGRLENKLSAETPGYLVNRLVYGQRLLNDAETVGVEIRPDSTVRNVIVENDQIVGVGYFHKNGKQHEVRAKITIDASGIIGIIRKNIPTELKNGINYDFLENDVIKTYREIIKLKGDKDHPYREEIILYYPPGIKPPGYIWIFSEGPKMLNIGITWVKSDPYPEGKTMKKLFHDYLDPYLPPDSYEIIHKGGGNIPMRPNFDSMVFNGAMLVGDAAGTVDPTTFEGHGPALESGRLAGKTAILALKVNSFKVADLWQYNIDFMRYPGVMHAQSHIAAKMIRDIDINGLKFLLERRIIDETMLRNLFQEKDTEIPNSVLFKKFLKAFPRWPMMRKLWKYMTLIDKAEEIYEEFPHKPEDLKVWRTKRNKVLKLSY
ncbi:MAG: NAD(P)/FAD-dependent oxidoreductase [Candidatus Heimdallarchaeota archaeon]|nr:NAD(P)/FAD-dependent oxidoreductase [Candidatus Heimdallarchaeota archaeon]